MFIDIRLVFFVALETVHLLSSNQFFTMYIHVYMYVHCNTQFDRYKQKLVSIGISLYGWADILVYIVY